MIVRTLVPALALSLAFVSSAFAADSYPRLATYAISSPHDYWDPAYQKKLAKLNFSVLTIYPNWGSSQNTDINTVAGQLKALNPATRVFVYVSAESIQDPPSLAWVELNEKVTKEQWWLYQSGLGGTRIPAAYAGNYTLNISSTARKDASGNTFGSWFASYVATEFGKPNPKLDGIFSDNIFWTPRKDGDWDHNGSVDSQSDATVRKNYRLGNRQYVDALRRNMPGKFQLGNLADWGVSGAVITEYQGGFDGGLFEGMVGKTWSIETTYGWQAMMTAYRKIMGALTGPKLAMCVQTGPLNGYQAMRYGLASCSLDDGYYVYSNEADTYHGVPWFDEFDAKLGAARSGPSTAAWQSGVYRRDFENGIVLVNPKGNGSRTVTLEADFTKLKGAQDPSVNNGATVRTVTLKDRDGVFLLRKGSAISPEVPANFSVQ